jgi:hypothetical protein
VGLPEKFFADFPKNELLILPPAAFSNTAPLTASVSIDTNTYNYGMPNVSGTIIPVVTDGSLPLDSIITLNAPGTNPCGDSYHFFQNVDGTITPTAPLQYLVVDTVSKPATGAKEKPPKPLHYRLLLCETSENFHITKLTAKYKISSGKTICGIPASGKRRLSENDAVTVLKHFIELWCKDCRKVAETEYKHVLEQ